MAYDLAMLNRLRVNAGKSELKSWKAKQSLLKEQIQALQAEGFVDTVPGANVNAEPVLPPDPEIAKAFKEPEKEKPTVEDDEGDDPEPEKKPVKTTKIKTALARGADAGAFTEHSRKSVQDQRIKEKADEKAERKKIKLDEKDQKQIKDEAEDRKPKGKVDEKKDPAKAKRQQDKIQAKRDKREAEGKLKPKREKSDKEISVADIARELDIPPKIARAKMRRHEDKLTKFRTKGYEEGWTFPKAAADTIRKILKGS